MALKQGVHTRAIVVLGPMETRPDGEPEWVPVSLRVDFAAMAGALDVDLVDITQEITAAVPGEYGFKQVHVQFDPDEPDGLQGVLSLLIEASTEPTEVEVYFTEQIPFLSPTEPLGEMSFDDGYFDDDEQTHHQFTVQTGPLAVVHREDHCAGLPRIIRLQDNATELINDSEGVGNCILNDSVQADTGAFLSTSPSTLFEVQEGDLCTTVRVGGDYTDAAGDTPPSNPQATYEFRYFAGSPIVHVSAVVSQDHPAPWDATYFLWLNLRDPATQLFDRWQIGTFPDAPDEEPYEEYQLNTDPEQTSPVHSWPTLWGALVNSGNDDYVAYLGGGQARLYDYAEPYEGITYYLRGQRERWTTSERRFDGALWLGRNPEGSGNLGAEVIHRAANQFRAVLYAYITVEPLEERLEELRTDIQDLPEDGRRGRFLWCLDRIERLGRHEGMLTEAIDLADQLRWALDWHMAQVDPQDVFDWFTSTDGLRLVGNDQIGLGFDLRSNGISLVSAFDLVAGRELLDGAPQTMWDAEALANGEHMALVSGDGWDDLDWAIYPHEDTGEPVVSLAWNTPTSSNLAWLSAEMVIFFEGPLTRWRLSVANSSDRAALRQVCFPRAWSGRIGDDEEAGRLAIPRRSGELIEAPVANPVYEHTPTHEQYQALYPSYRGNMQFMAHYNDGAGLYLATHDPLASMKEIVARHGQAPGGRRDGVFLSYRWPVENMSDTGNIFEMDREVPDPNDPAAGNVDIEARAVLGAFRGDWYDAAQIYRTWAETAPWWPESDENGRLDTPEWMTDIAFWIVAGSSDVFECMEMGMDPQWWIAERDRVIGLANQLRALEPDAPVAVHWYWWSEEPLFDCMPEDFFEAKADFVDQVITPMRTEGILFMPYLNGRLWDVNLPRYTSEERWRDGSLPEGGEPGNEADHLSESYSRQPRDEGCNPIYDLGVGGFGLMVDEYKVMCSVVERWAEEVVSIAKLAASSLPPYGLGADAVYLDQVASAEPVPCFDENHGHPLGGGHWWSIDGYWKMLRDLRASPDVSQDQVMLTSESANEAYVHLFHGMLPWKWTYENQVPLFPAVYGGRVILFGRTYADGSEPAGMIMKAGQALVFGEQIGWIPTLKYDVTAWPGSPWISSAGWQITGPFFWRVARLRYHFRDYFRLGRLARPPILQWPPDSGPEQVTAYWGGWGGDVTTDVILSGAWQRPDGDLLLLLAHVSDQHGPQTCELAFDGAVYGFDEDAWLVVTQHDEDGPLATEDTVVVQSPFRLELTLGQLAVRAIEIRETHAPFDQIGAAVLGHGEPELYDSFPTEQTPEDEDEEATSGGGSTSSAEEDQTTSAGGGTSSAEATDAASSGDRQTFGAEGFGTDDHFEGVDREGWHRKGAEDAADQDSSQAADEEELREFGVRDPLAWDSIHGAEREDLYGSGVRDLSPSDGSQGEEFRRTHTTETRPQKSRKSTRRRGR